MPSRSVQPAWGRGLEGKMVWGISGAYGITVGRDLREVRNLAPSRSVNTVVGPLGLRRL